MQPLTLHYDGEMGSSCLSFHSHSCSVQDTQCRHLAGWHHGNRGGCAGIANDKAVAVRASSGDEVCVEITKKSTKTGKNVVSVNKKGTGRLMAAVRKEGGDYRPDLQELATSAAAVAAGAAARSKAEATASA